MPREVSVIQAPTSTSHLQSLFSVKNDRSKVGLWCQTGRCTAVDPSSQKCTAKFNPQNNLLFSSFTLVFLQAWMFSEGAKEVTISSSLRAYPIFPLSFPHSTSCFNDSSWAERKDVQIPPEPYLRILCSTPLLSNIQHLSAINLFYDGLKSSGTSIIISTPFNLLGWNLHWEGIHFSPSLTVSHPRVWGCKLTTPSHSFPLYLLT